MYDVISEAAKAKAVELAKAHGSGVGSWHDLEIAAPGHALVLARYIQRASDAARDAHEALGRMDRVPDGQRAALAALILPEPPDPLYDALHAVVELGRYDTREQTELLRGELKARGLEIRPLS